jgi:hypothetical protein
MVYQIRFPKRMDLTEAGLELLVKRLRALIEVTVQGMNPAEVSLVSGKVPAYRPMLEFREIRDRFLGRFNDPCPIPQATSYAEELLKHATDDHDLPPNVKQSLRDFFNAEIARVGRIRDIIFTRCLQPNFYTRTQMPVALLTESLTRHAFACHEGLGRLEMADDTSYTSADIMSQLQATLTRRKRNCFLKSVLRRVRRFPLIHAEEIFTTMFEEATQSFQSDQLSHAVPVLLRTEDELDRELERLARVFCLDPDFEANDGQQFVYHCDKFFDEIFGTLQYNESACLASPTDFLTNDARLADLTQQSLISGSPRDAKLQQLFSDVSNLDTEQAAAMIHDTVEHYNGTVGNQPRSRAFAANRTSERPSLPRHKLTPWLKLRFLHAKFLAFAVMSHSNYFEHVLCQLATNSVAVTRSTKYRCRQSRMFSQILEVVEGNVLVVFKGTPRRYEQLIDQLVSVGSYYTLQFEANGEDGLVDRTQIMERLLGYELQYLNAKRELLQSLIEVLEHRPNDALKKSIPAIVEERPQFNFPIYKSFDAPYTLAIKLMKQKATVIRALMNLQMFHERDCAVRFDDSVPLFDKPSLVPSEGLLYRSFVESFPISPFEVYESLTLVGKFLALVPKVTVEMTESAHIRFIRYGCHMELAVWKKLTSVLGAVFHNGLLPADMTALHFEMKLSESADSLFTSPFTNSVEAVEPLISNMGQGRKLRFMLSTRRLFHLAYKLQLLVIETMMFQKAYAKQCELLGIADRGVSMAAFKESALKEIIDLHTPKGADLVLEFALTEFERVTMNFADESSIKDIIFASGFSVFKRLIQFQVLQNSIFEIAIRFNRCLLDSNFFVQYFELSADTTFLTGVPEEKSRFFKHVIAAQIFYESVNLFRDNQLALLDKQQFCLSIREIKAKSRTILSAHAKQKAMSDQEMLEIYLSEMVDAFSAYAYRVELTRICLLERQILLTNSFVDTYSLGPDPTTCLVDAAGKFRKFFYVPTWVEIFLMIRSAPHARQGMVLRSTLKYVQSRFRIMNLVRFECSLSQRLRAVFESLYDECFQCDTPVFQQVFSELGQLPNASEVEIATKFISEREKFYFHRFEYAVLTSIEAFCIAVTAQSFPKPRVSDPEYDEKMKTLWLQMHAPLETDPGLMNQSRYIPPWQAQFLCNCMETDRSDLVIRLGTTDTFLRNVSIAITDEIAVIPVQIDFLCLSISQFHIKMAYFLLLTQKDESEIDLRATIADLTPSIYSEGAPRWEDTIIRQANEHLVPKDESPSRVKETVPEPKLAQAIFDVVRSQVDLMLLSSQIKQVQAQIDAFSELLGRVPELSHLLASSLMTDTVLHFLGLEPVVRDTIAPGSYYIPTVSLINAQFVTELNRSHTKFVEFLQTVLDRCLVRQAEDQVLYDGQILDVLCSRFSFALATFSSGTLHSVFHTWKKYLATVSASIAQNQESMGVVAMMAQVATSRFDKQTESEIGSRFHSRFIELNTLRSRLQKLDQVRQRSCDDMERDIRGHYNVLLGDLHAAIERQKKAGAGVKRKVYDDVLSKINRAKNVALILRTAAEIEQDRVNQPGPRLDDQFLAGIRKGNEEMRREIMLTRICRCLNQTAVRLHYSKRLDAIAEDRQGANEALWSVRLRTHAREHAMERRLYDAHQLFGLTQQRIDQLMMQLENVEFGNIQLVHWKAKNLKTIEGLKRQIAVFHGVGDINIDNLVRKLDAAHAQLDELLDFGDELETRVDEAVRQPLRQLDETRDDIADARTAEVLTITKTGPVMLEEEKRQNKIEFVRRTRAENEELRERIATVKCKIEELEQLKLRKPMAVREFMEDTLHTKSPSLRAMSRFGRGKILKPTVLIVNRAHSRI